MGFPYVGAHFDENEVDRFLFLYPNPNPKPSDASKRWSQMPFMKHAIRCLKPEGEIWMVSNEAWYIDEAREALSAQLQIKEELKIDLDRFPNWRFRTHFEKKYLQRGQTCHQIVFRKGLN